MSRRPDDVMGDLIFQEGKQIEGDYYIIAVYDDPASCTLSFSAYELENDRTYTMPFSYSHFDKLFRFNAALMNPAAQDGRFNWVIKRLDFIVDDQGQRVLCLADEPTPDPDEDLVDKKKTENALAPTNYGNIDAATRAKLLKELDTQDDEKLRRWLMKSEEAAKRFLLALHAKRQLEQLKAAQRLLKADEKREARLAKLAFVVEQQAEKAAQIKAKESAKASTQAQLESLLKQKEAQAIRRLKAEKDEEERGMGRDKDAARQRRKIAERMAQDTKKLEEEQAKKTGAKRDAKVVIQEKKIVAYNNEIAEKLTEFMKQEAQTEVQRELDKKALVKEIWENKAKAQEEEEEKNAYAEEMERVRDAKNDAKHVQRTKKEGEYIRKMQQVHEEQLQETLRRRRKQHTENLRMYKNALVKRQQARDAEKRKAAQRDKSIAANMEVTLRRFRETQFLQTAQARGRAAGDAADEAESEDMEATAMPGGAPSSGETEELRKMFAQQERQKRFEAIAAKRELEKEKVSKMKKLAADDPNAKEVQRFQEMKREQEAIDARIAAARKQRDDAFQAKNNEAIERSQKRDALWEDLEERRREASLERNATRTTTASRYARSYEKGAGLPSMVLVF